MSGLCRATHEQDVLAGREGRPATEGQVDVGANAQIRAVHVWMIVALKVFELPRPLNRE